VLELNRRVPKEGVEAEEEAVETNVAAMKRVVVVLSSMQ
jgi:hypothetical protein